MAGPEMQQVMVKASFHVGQGRVHNLHALSRRCGGSSLAVSFVSPPIIWSELALPTILLAATGNCYLCALARKQPASRKPDDLQSWQNGGMCAAVRWREHAWSSPFGCHRYRSVTFSPEEAFY